MTNKQNAALITKKSKYGRVMMNEWVIMSGLRHKKNSKKAVKLDSFFQCSVHRILGHDGCFSKINLRILWKHVMKNFQVKHGRCDSIIFPKKISFESSK